MNPVFTRTFQVNWSDLDANAHMKNTAYMEKAVDVRMMYFREQGFPMSEFERLRLGPVITRDEIEYYREFRLLEAITVTLTLAGLNGDASRFRLRNELYRADGRLAAKLTSKGGWLDLDKRKLILPPPTLAQAMYNLTRSEDFEEIA